MAKAVPNPPPGFDELPIDEKIEYVQSLWNRVAATPEQIPVPQWHLQTLNERLDAYRKSPRKGKTWGRVKKEVRRKLRRSSTER